jgi:UDP-N-acetylglucosamine/UDP-N-acetylgalactosamine diphosphorylase
MPQLDLAERLAAARLTLAECGQEHLLHFWEGLDTSSRAKLLDQIEQQDWTRIAQLIQTHVLAKPEVHLPSHIEPAPSYPHQPTPELADRYARARRHGEQLIREGKVAAFTVAGGQGTRLGFDGPKGAYPATPIIGKPLFQVFAEFIIKTQRKYDAVVPWYIMTSPANDAPTRAFFDEHNHFGLDPAHVIFFPQGTMPSIGLDGKVLLAGQDELALNPDGHGGSLRALHTSGAIDDMAKRGITQISYFQIDNANVKCIDPLFIGLHDLDGGQMSSKMIPKTEPFERVGNFCLIDDRVTVIEYSDLPDELATQTHDDGSLRFLAGSIAIHVMSVEFVRELNAGEFGLPFHRADKKVPHIDIDSGRLVEPDAPNAVKLETFVFDALPLCKTSIIYETDRVEDFAPIKNPTGVDSAESSKQLQSRRAARWLQAAGVEVPFNKDGQPDAVIELSHLTAVEPQDLQAADLPARIERGGEVVL